MALIDNVAVTVKVVKFDRMVRANADKLSQKFWDRRNQKGFRYNAILEKLALQPGSDTITLADIERAVVDYNPGAGKSSEIDRSVLDTIEIKDLFAETDGLVSFEDWRDGKAGAQMVKRLNGDYPPDIKKVRQQVASWISTQIMNEIKVSREEAFADAE